MDFVDEGHVDAARDARSCTISDQHGENITFGQLLDTQQSQTKRILLIFIRHFFCGNCQEYVRRISTDLSPSTLPKDLSIIIVGCGAPTLIPSYAELTNCPFPIYSDPTTNLYKALGMHRSLSLGPRGPAYIRHSLASGVVKSIVQGLKRIPNGDVMQAGDLDVNGGEFILTRSKPDDAQWNTVWSHCMVNTRDHTEVDQLLKMLSVHAPETTAASIPLDINNATSQKPASTKRMSWVVRAGNLKRSGSIRRSVVQVT